MRFAKSVLTKPGATYPVFAPAPNARPCEQTNPDGQKHSKGLKPPRHTRHKARLPRQGADRVAWDANGARRQGEHSDGMQATARRRMALRPSDAGMS